jgi:hypothetical protein
MSPNVPSDNRALTKLDIRNNSMGYTRGPYIRNSQEALQQVCVALGIELTK